MSVVEPNVEQRRFSWTGLTDRSSLIRDPAIRRENESGAEGRIRTAKKGLPTHLFSLNFQLMA